MTLRRGDQGRARDRFQRIVAMTLTLAAVYAPLAFLPGAHRAAVRRVALALAGAMVVSASWRYALAHDVLQAAAPRGPAGRFDRFMERVLVRISQGYDRLLGLSLQVRWLVVGVMLASAARAGGC